MSKPTRQPAERSRFPSGRLIRAHGRFGFAAVALTVVLASALPPAVSVASGPSANMALNYQARITNSTGISLADGSKSVKFVIYDALSGGNCEYTARGTCSATESDQLGKDVTIANGSFSTVIGESGDNSLDGVFSGDEERYLEIRVYNGASYEIMSPRKRIVSSAFALNANLLDDLDTSNTGGSGAFVPVTDSTGNFTLTKNVNFAGGTFFIDASTSRVGIGDTDPAALFTVGSGGLFRVNSSGEVTAAAGITSSGSITFSGVASGVVVADASGVLSGGHLIDLTADVNGILAVANGGTGASSLTDGGILLGSGTGAVTAMSVLGDGAIVIGDGTTDPVPLSAFTSSTGYLKHEYGGLEADVSAITTGGLFRGTGAGTVGILAVGNEGQVLTAQADGSVIWEDASGGGDMAIGGTVTSGTAGSILFVGSGPVLAQDNGNLFWDDSGDTLTVNGSAAFGNASTVDTVSFAGSRISSSLAPSADATYGLGSADLRWSGIFSDTLTVGSGGPLTVDSSGNVGVAARIDMGNHGEGSGLNLPLYGEPPTAGGSTAEGDIVWDFNNDKLYVYDGSDFAEIGGGGGDMAIGGTVTSGTAGSILFVGSGPVLAQDNSNFFWDNSSKELGIGTNSPSATLHVAGGSYFGGDVFTDRWLSGGSATSKNTGIGVDVFGAGSLSHSVDSEGYFNTAVGSSSLYSVSSGYFNTAVGYNALLSGTTSSNNVAVGANALDAITSNGGGLVAIGYNALSALTTGNYNTAVGFVALATETSGSGNTAIGYQAIVSSNGGSNNTAIGYRVGYSISTGNDNVLVGSRAGDAITSSSGNIAIGSNALGAMTNNGTGYTVAIGHNALSSLTDGAANTAIGYNALLTATSGGFSTAIGYNALDSMTTGYYNTAIGYNSLNSESGGNYNTAVGSGTLASSDGGYNNTAIGRNALATLSVGADNTAIGSGAGYYNRTGGYNVSIGKDAGKGVSNSSNVSNSVMVGYLAGAGILTGGDDNVLIGSRAGDAVTASAGNIAIGSNALGAMTDNGTDYTVAIGHNALAALTDGDYNTAIGYNALTAATSGGYSTAIGYRALAAETTGGYSTAVGYGTLSSSNGGSNNVALGFNTLALLTTGGNNVAVGNDALGNNQTGGENAALGSYALYNNTGDYSVAMGHTSLYDNTSGTSNVGIGNRAGYYNRTGGYNVFVGRDAGLGASSLSNISNGVMIGYRAGASIRSGGDDNVLIGYQAGDAVTASAGNIAIGSNALGVMADNGSDYTIAIGHNALSALTTGDYNTAIGYNALTAATSGGYSTAIGYEAGSVISTNGGITAVGYNALKNASTAYNAAVGAFALDSLGSGNWNTAVGYEAGQALISNSNNSFFGYRAGYLVTGGNNTLVGSYAGDVITTGTSNVVLGYYSDVGNADNDSNIVIGYNVQTGTGDYLLNIGDLLTGTMDGTKELDVDGNIEFDVPSGTATYALCHSTNGAQADALIYDCSGTPSADYSEQYAVDPGLSYGDVVAVGEGTVTTTEGFDLRRMVRSVGPYQENVIGVISNPDDAGDFNSIGYNIRDEDNPMPIALNGRVMTRVTGENGPIEAGDPLTTSSTPGAAMRATKPGMVIGYALNDWSDVGEGRIMVFISQGWHSGKSISTDGASSLFRDSFAFDGSGRATVSETARDSHLLSFIGSAWDFGTGEAMNRSISVRNAMTDTDSYRLSLTRDDGGEIAYFGSSGDVALRGNLFPSDRGVMQNTSYIYYDGSAGPGGDMMRTNAAGWGTGSYDFAEMFPSDDALKAGELVMFDVLNQTRIRRAERNDVSAFLLAGVVSTRPGFLAGMNDAGSHPMALAGRVPTKVNAENGAINIGDPITVSSVPGVGMRAKEPGYVVGIALEAFDGTEPEGKITVYVRPGWFNGLSVSQVTDISGEGGATQLSSGVMDRNLDMAGYFIVNVGIISGLDGLWSIDGNGNMTIQDVTAEAVKAKEITVEQTDEVSAAGESAVLIGNSTVTVENPLIRPNSRIFVTFYGNTEGGWWISRRVDGAFEVSLQKVAPVDLRFEYLIVSVLDSRTPTIPPADEPPAEEPPAEDPPADEPPADEPPADEPPADEPPAGEEPPVGEYQDSSTVSVPEAE